MDKGIFRHLWKSYLTTIDGRQKYGDVELLAEAAERMVWPGAPEMGAAIAKVLRDKVVGDKKGSSAKHFHTVRDRELFRLSLLLEGQEGPFDLEREGGTQQYTSKYKYIADMYTSSHVDHVPPGERKTHLDHDAVRKVVQRTRQQIARVRTH